MSDGKVVQGGAKTEQVKVEKNAPPPVENGIDIKTTASGTFSKRGLVPIGTKATVSADAYSEAWMKPATAAAAKKVEALLAARAEAKADKGN